MKRNNDRYNLINCYSDSFSIEDIYISADINGTLKGTVVDLSLSGLGFQFSSITGEQVEFLKTSENHFLKLYIGESFILIGVSLAWSVVSREGERNILKGGFEIHTISPEDNIRLSNLVDAVRNDA